MTQDDMFDTTPYGQLKPRTQRVHENSRKAYHEERPKLSKRCADILHGMRHGAMLTDRDIMGHMGFTDMNAVRPRITELIDAGYLMEVGKVKCPVTGKTVRVVGVNADNKGLARYRQCKVCGKTQQFNSQGGCWSTLDAQRTEIFNSVCCNLLLSASGEGRP